MMPHFDRHCPAHNFGSSWPAQRLPARLQRSNSPGSPRMPCLTTSASPLRSSPSGRVASSCGSASTRPGGWKAPTRFLPCGRSAPVLPPRLASTMAQQRGRQRHPAHPAQVGRGGKPGQVADHPAAQRHHRAAALQTRLQELFPQTTDGFQRSCAASPAGITTGWTAYPASRQECSTALRHKARLHSRR